MKYCYKAFNFSIESDVEIKKLKQSQNSGTPDIIIKNGDLSEYSIDGDYSDKGPLLVNEKNNILFKVEGIATFKVFGGREITVDEVDGVQTETIDEYILGICLCIIAQQRGLIALHGSCVYDGEHAVIICGESGAGKSTMATEFIKNGWLLVSDDLSIVDDTDGNYYVRPSIPYQKLWSDTIEYYNIDKAETSPLLQNSIADKYNVGNHIHFYNKSAKLEAIVSLSCGDVCSFNEVAGGDKIVNIVDNICMKRHFADAEANRNIIISVLGIADKTRVFKAERTAEICSSRMIYKKIVAALAQT